MAALAACLPAWMRGGPCPCPCCPPGPDAAAPRPQTTASSDDAPRMLYPINGGASGAVAPANPAEDELPAPLTVYPLSP